MRGFLAAALLVAMLAAFRPLSATAFSVGDVLAAPFVDDLTASPDGTVLVWKVHFRGSRNLYTNAGGTVHAVTHFDADDGQDIDQVAITPSNDAAVYLRGGVQDNAAGENPNPSSVVPPPERAIYIVPLSGADPVKVADGNAVALSPRGDAVAYTTEQGVLNIVALTKSGATYTVGKPDPLAIRGQASDMAWSPDGSRIAFTDARNGVSYIVIYTPSKHSYVYASPDFSQDDGAAWSPEGTRVAFIRTPGAREDESIYLRPPRGPWSIWVADPATGNARMVWDARRGMGATYYVNETSSNTQLWWMRGDRVAFNWEGDGWQHLYTVPARGGSATALMRGNFEVETVAESLDRTQLLYATNEGDIDRRHIWSVALDGHPRALTTGTNDQWSPTPLANGGYAYVDAGYSAPPVVTIAGNPPRTLVAVPAAANFPANELVRPQLVTFHSADGLLIHAQFFLPRGGSSRHAAIVFDHGGPVRQMLPGFHYMEAYTQLYEMNQYLVNRGFVVLSINYRSGIMYGHDFRQAKHVGQFGAAEYQDVLAGARWLRRRPEVDPNRLGIYGLSYGGYLTALGLSRNSDIFKAGADFAGVVNWATLYDWYAGGKIIGTPAQRALAVASSPIASLDRWRSPVFLSQGDDDRNVAFSQGVDLATRLRDRNVHVETMVFPNETHENQVWAHLVAQYQAAADFLARYLRP
jgi:dipeptidyl aminopeptidase/acylaminoacyl peptidase